MKAMTTPDNDEDSHLDTWTGHRQKERNKQKKTKTSVQRYCMSVSIAFAKGATTVMSNEKIFNTLYFLKAMCVRFLFFNKMENFARVRVRKKCNIWNSHGIVVVDPNV